MAYTNPVADFVSSLDPFYESVSMEDLEKAIGPLERGNLIGMFVLTNLKFNSYFLFIRIQTLNLYFIIKLKFTVNSLYKYY